MSEKTLPPSHARLRQAREKGQFGISQEFSKLLKFTIIAEAVFGIEPLWRAMLDQNLSVAVESIAQPWQVRFDGAWSTFTTAALVMLVLAGVSALISLLSVLSQTGFNVAPKAFESGIQKLNPANNLKQLVAPKKFLMLLLGPLKIGVLLMVGYFEIRSQLPNLAQLYRLSPQQGWMMSMQTLHHVERQCLGVLIVLAIIDIALQRYMNYRSMRMDVEEMRRDYKEAEGDPHTKGQRKGIAKQNAMEAPQMRAPGATAVVVNPEHIAVALAYDIREGTLPRIVDKGRDADADLLRKIASERHIPVIKYVGLARQLYATGQTGTYVPRQTLRAVALLCKAVQELSAASYTAGPADEIHEIDEELGNSMLAGQPSTGRRNDHTGVI